MASFLSIGLNAECQADFLALQLKKKKDAHKHIRYMVMCIEVDEKKKESVVTESKAAPGQYKDDQHDEVYEAFRDAITKSGQPRFGCIDYKNKVIFVSWVPDTAQIKLKMKYTSIKEPVKGSLSGISFTIQATDSGELAQSVLDAKVKKV